MSDNPNPVNKTELETRLKTKLAKLGIELPPIMKGGSKRRIKTFRLKQRRGTRRLLK